MPSVYVIEPLWTGVKHVRFNSAFLKVLEKCFPNDSIHFYAESSHLAGVSRELGESREQITLSRIYLPYQNKRYKIPFLYLMSLIQSIWALIRFSSKGLLVFSAANPLTLAPLCFANFFLRRRCVIVAHGELAFLDKGVSRRLNFHYKLQASTYRFAFKIALAAKGIYFIILGEFIAKSLEKHVPQYLLSRKTLIMEHPYLFSPTYILNAKPINGHLNLAIIGLATRAKGADQIVVLYRLLEKKGILDKVKLSVIGKVADFEKDLEGTQITYYTDSDFIRQEDYDRLIGEQDFILFFYPDEIYKLTASGSFLDCLLHDKPIVALRNSFFDHYFQRIGKIGYLADTIGEMANYIEQEVNISPTTMSEMRREEQYNLKMMRSYFSPSQIAISLKQQLINKKLAKIDG